MKYTTLEPENKIISSVNRSKVNSDTINLSMSISKIRKNSHKLSKMYDFKKYINSADMSFPEDVIVTIDVGPYSLG